ncbi:pyridoxamine 5'-phosphate oxidase family protein [Desulfitobacterium sp.]|uniref:pyridoxamine 5'-phosphate oxidase family protein n=1 Tax=Desulfitobacterium sp. TaxID=49981 RepID=UPI002B21CA91|nr:pyridoxamine 5'-phosphate oxidase family protein [Desulfitobacterium sp.]MEA4900969.1 pyridoxamine 5'-phosphate oxidase family protein [Desulfitobacterium sp.]
MRRIDREITSFNEIMTVMKACEVCHIAFLDDDYPYVVPMNFGMQVDGHDVILYFHGANIGKKHDLIKKNNKVAFVMECTHGIVTSKQVGACECTMEFESIMGTGIIDYVDDNQKVEALHTLLEHYSVCEGPEYHFHDEIVPNTTVLRLKVHDLSGKKRSV